MESIDLQQAKLHYTDSIKSGEVTTEITIISEFTLSEFARQIDQGKAIFDFAEDQLEFDPGGSVPIYNREGYIL